ncbi:hypothetical protein B0H65DRAFT_25076 [Neurospora tetraspora]|uniref:Uncharacterized protein n=1 Tax=Neurospora tetraspora TaxID=94610 RepID=A0AAE0MVU0_9PEZI|nr:hypothetical protein B0H65DRAFT_25076 [Neurospora tetraspora]
MAVYHARPSQLEIILLFIGPVSYSIPTSLYCIHPKYGSGSYSLLKLNSIFWVCLPCIPFSEEFNHFIQTHHYLVIKSSTRNLVIAHQNPLGLGLIRADSNRQKTKTPNLTPDGLIVICLLQKRHGAWFGELSV